MYEGDITKESTTVNRKLGWYDACTYIGKYVYVHLCVYMHAYAFMYMYMQSGVSVPLPGGTVIIAANQVWWTRMQDQERIQDGIFTPRLMTWWCRYTLHVMCVYIYIYIYVRTPQLSGPLPFKRSSLHSMSRFVHCYFIGGRDSN